MIREKEIFWDGKWQKAKFLRGGNQVWLHVGGEIHTYEPHSAIKELKEAFDYGPMKSPMPGKIMKIYCQKGETKEANQTLVVMEAMKMEYTIKAPKAVKVTKIHCSEGSQVKEGEVLIEVEKVKED